MACLGVDASAHVRAWLRAPSRPSRSITTERLGTHTVDGGAADHQSETLIACKQAGSFISGADAQI